jgi:hypothetical protein
VNEQFQTPSNLLYTNLEIKPLAQQHGQSKFKLVVQHKGIIKTANYIGEEVFSRIQEIARYHEISVDAKMHVTIEIKVEKAD